MNGLRRFFHGDQPFSPLAAWLNGTAAALNVFAGGVSLGIFFCRGATLSLVGIAVNAFFVVASGLLVVNEVAKLMPVAQKED